jgi:galactose mutarotase-like enzyme
MHSLKNDLLQIHIKSAGAELCAINAIKNKNTFMWHADPKIWGSYAPNLFPIIGCMKDDTYIYKDQKYNMTKHGFVRHNENMRVKNRSENQITFLLQSNAELYKMYPFHFEFEISYTLDKNVLTVNHIVKNLDDKTMYFSLGGHPAFKCPLHYDEHYTDYILEFNEKETSQSYLLNMKSGLVTEQTRPVFTSANAIALRSNLFNEDALIFKDLKSRQVALKHKTKGTALTVKFEDFPYLGLWAKPNAPYVCIEPWLGIADAENTNQKIEEKEGILALDANDTFSASYSIEIDERHLA